MFFLKKVIFKFMELGLGLRTCFSLETKNPIFVNFKLTPAETEKVKAALPAGYRLCPIRFSDSDLEESFWISYNFYELKYPKPELAKIKKSRLEINTFVEDSVGRKGIFVFCDSPFVSKESKISLIGIVCDFAEWLVTKIYGVGRLISLEFQLNQRLKVQFKTSGHSLSLDIPVDEDASVKLSSDYLRFNDVSFFNQGKTCDFVNVNSAFYEAKFISISNLENVTICEGHFFKRRPDTILVHHGEIAYLVNSMNRCFFKGEVYG